MAWRARPQLSVSKRKVSCGMTLRPPSVSKDLFESLDAESATALLESRFQFLADAGCTTEEAVLMALHAEVEVEDALRLSCVAALYEQRSRSFSDGRLDGCPGARGPEFLDVQTQPARLDDLLRILRRMGYDVEEVGYAKIRVTQGSVQGRSGSSCN